MIIQTDITDLPKAAADMIVRAETSGKPYFVLIEEENVDISSHNHDLAGMKKAIRSFDTAVKAAVELSSPDTTVIVLADHETGGLSGWCRFKSSDHTGGKVPLLPQENMPVCFRANWIIRKSIIKSAEYCLRRHKIP